MSKVIASGMLLSNIPMYTFAEEIDKLTDSFINIESNSNNTSTLYTENTNIQSNGVVDNKYVVTNLDDLKQLRTEINVNNLDTSDITIELIGDIDFTGESTWEAIGTSKNGFKGTFNGNGYSFKNLNLDNVDFEGIFSNTGESTFKNLNIENFSIKNSTATFVATLVGISNGNVNFESITLNNIEIDATKSHFCVGGLIAYNPNGKITKFTNIEMNNSIINVKTATYVGGLIGSGTINLENIKTSIEINAPANSSTGGLIGADATKISSPLSFKNIELDLTINGGNSTGGLMGSCTSNDINVNNVSVMGEYVEGGNAGGLIGNATTTISLKEIDIQLKNVIGKGNAGGLIGSASKSITLEDINVSSIITGKSNVGGLIGLNISQVINGTNIQVIDTTLNAEQYVGTIAGYNTAKSELDNIKVDTIVKAQNTIGGLYGYSTGVIKVENSTIKAILEASETIGGIVGQTLVNIELNNNNINTNITGVKKLGGLIGQISGINDSNLTTNNIQSTINGESYIGGLIGYSTSTDIDVVNNTVECDLVGKDSIGGLIGYGASTAITSNKVIGTIKGNEKVGGLVGEIYSSEKKLISKNDIRANIQGDNYVGGISGYSHTMNSQNNLILNKIKGNTNIGGVSGGIKANSNSEIIVKSTVIASEIISDNANVLFGEYNNDGTLEVKDVYYDKELTPIDNEYANGLKTSQMKGKESLNLMNLDFNTIWKANKETYPMFEQLNSSPDIIPNDKVVDLTITINQYDKFNLFDYITVEDFEGDAYTVSTKTTKEDFDTSKYGTYPITIIATDDKGLSNELTLTLKINPLPIKVNEAPIIIAENITITVGDEFNPSKIVVAVDREDGIITNNVKVIENTVNINKAGVYKVTYEIEDKDGAKTTKTIQVTVKDKPTSNTNSNGSNTTDKDDDKNKDEDKTDKPQTSDVGLVGMSGLLISTIGLVSLNRKQQN